jgi:hypothetical protein
MASDDEFMELDRPPDGPYLEVRDASQPFNDDEWLLRSNDAGVGSVSYSIRQR